MYIVNRLKIYKVIIERVWGEISTFEIIMGNF